VEKKERKKEKQRDRKTERQTDRKKERLENPWIRKQTHVFSIPLFE
jgi:hypothetical protein